MAQLKEGSIIKKSTGDEVVATLNDIPTKATQAEAEAGTDDTKIMTPLKVKQVTEQFATKTELANIDLTEELENLATKAELADKVDKVSGKQLSTNDYTTVEKNKLSGIQDGAEKNVVTSVNGQTGAITISDTTYDIVTTLENGLMSSADKTKLDGVEVGAEKNNVTNTDIANWNNKVDKVSGKQLSTNDYTTTEKNKLSGIQAGAEANTVTSVNGQTGAVTTPNTTYDVATTSANGLMSSADKVKLDKFTEIENKPYYNDEAIATVKDIPLNTSELTNDSGYVEQDGLDNRVRFITETQYDTLKTNNNIEANITYIVYK